MKSRIVQNNNPILVFDEKQRIQSEQTFKRTWDEFRDALAANKFAYDDTVSAKGMTFLKQFNDLFQNVGKDFLTVSLYDVFATYKIGRGTVLKPDEDTPYDRFVPKAQFIGTDNRFSPPGIEWLYLAIGETDELIQQCSEKECRAKTSDRFGFCHFELNPAYEDTKIVDLTKGTENSFDDINGELSATVNDIFEKEVSTALISGQNRGMSKESNDKFRTQLYLWSLSTYSKMLAEEIFVPVVDSQKRLEYTPFQTLAKYFEREGYEGIIYKSTVFKGAKNIVLFDKNCAKPFGIILDYTII